MDELEVELKKYAERIISFLPLEKEYNKLKREGLSYEEIKERMGPNADIIEYVPKVLYHGSPKCLDIINPKESTQAGSAVYATDNPMHALFFSIFRNSSQVRAHIHEYIDDNGEYQVEYILDERYAGALDETLTDEPVTIHVLNGEDFYKPLGEQYINREWVSKEGKAIIPTDKITVSPKEVLNIFKEKGLLHISYYDKSKDPETIIDMLSMNYPFGLNTKKALEDPEGYEEKYDNYIKEHFPEYLYFSKKFREYARKIMEKDEPMDKKLRTIRKAGKTLLESKTLDMDVLEEKGKSR